MPLPSKTLFANANLSEARPTGIILGAKTLSQIPSELVKQYGDTFWLPLISIYFTILNLWVTRKNFHSSLIITDGAKSGNPSVVGNVEL